MAFLEVVGRTLARHLVQPNKRVFRVATCKSEQLATILHKGHVPLIEGSSRFSTAIKYLTQSTWSHAVLYVNEGPIPPGSGLKGDELLEADLLEGVRRKAGLIPMN